MPYPHGINEDIYNDLFKLVDCNEEGYTKFTKAGKNKIAQYLVCKHIEHEGKLKVSFNDAAIEDALVWPALFMLRIMLIIYRIIGILRVEDSAIWGFTRIPHKLMVCYYQEDISAIAI